MEEIRMEQELTPSQYFEMLKEKKEKSTDDYLNNLYDNCMELLNKAVITGQTKVMKKIIFHLDAIEREREIIKMGVDTFIYRDDIEEYIDHISKDVVKIIELENYEREIPDEIVNAIAQVKDKFDMFYVLFTDYTGKVERQVVKERRDKDPILFGTFEDNDSSTIIDRFYYIGDWVDEYCDLTLDKMVAEFKSKRNKNVEKKISSPKDLAELKEQLSKLETHNNGFRIVNSNNLKVTNNKPQKFFDKVRSIFKK